MSTHFQRMTDSMHKICPTNTGASAPSPRNPFGTFPPAVAVHEAKILHTHIRMPRGEGAQRDEGGRGTIARQDFQEQSFQALAQQARDGRRRRQKNAKGQ